MTKSGNPVLRHTILLSMTQAYFNPAHTSAHKGAYNACCHYRHKALPRHVAIMFCQVLISGWHNYNLYAFCYNKISVDI